MRHEATKSLFEYWDRIRGNRPAPNRVEIEPSDIRKLLGNTFILDVSGMPRIISYRLAGTKLCAAYGKELKGVGFLVPWDEADCFALTGAIAKVYKDNTPQIIASTGKTDSGRFAEFETILLPLQSADSNANRILGLTSAKKTPFWLGAEAITSNSVRSIRDASAISNTEFKNATLSPSLETSLDLGQTPNLSPYNDGTLELNLSGSSDSDSQNAQSPQKPARRKVGHLTVMDGGKS